MIIKCYVCGSTFKQKPSHIKEHNFCSRKCYHEWQARNSIHTVCERCGKTIRKPPSKKTERNFCSQSCLCKTLAEEYNPTKMTEEVRQKISISHQTSLRAIKSREKRFGNREFKGYKKVCGRHEHRIVAEEILGRALKKGEVVHHIDGNKRNNSPENLMIFRNQKEHAKWHAEHDRGWGK